MKMCLVNVFSFFAPVDEENCGLLLPSSYYHNPKLNQDALRVHALRCILTVYGMRFYIQGIVMTLLCEA